MEQFMKHFVQAILRAKPEDIVTSFDEDFDDFDSDEDEEDLEEGQDVRGKEKADYEESEAIEEAFDYSTDDDLPDFLVRATNVYRTDYYIVRQQILYKNDPIFGGYMCSKDTFFYRTPERDRQYVKAFPKRADADGKRISTLMYVRKYID